MADIIKFNLGAIGIKNAVAMLQPLAKFSARLMFKKPFLLIGNVAGLISALIIALGEWTWQHV